MKSRYPTRIGRYEVIDRLGVGGMGAVYLASDPSLGRTVAIKILNSDEDELQERFEREARSAASLRHQHIVTIYDIGEHEGRPFLAMEFLDGESMAEMIRRRMPLALDARLDLFCQLCSGLGYAHRRGIIHRDIKPANLMITSERVLKIVDFGLARLATGGSTMTRAGTLMGTPNYMSPEQAQGATVDHLSDIFSTGLVFYELISYRRAYAGDSTPAILHNIVHGEPEPISSVLPDIDPELEQVVRKAIEKPKERRYQQLGDLAIDVERIRQRLHAQSIAVDGATVVIERPSTELETGGPPLEGGSRRASKPPSSYVGRTSPEARRNLDAIAQRRIAQIAQRVAAAAEHAEAGRLQEAVEECEQALLLDPQDARARQLLEQVHEAMAERQISALVEQARSELSHGALTLASEHVEQALQVRSDSPQARGLREQIREKRRRRERDAERVRNVQAAMERAERNLQEGALEAAVRGALEALGYDRENQEALALRDRALAAIEERRLLAYERAAQEALADARHQADAGNYNQALALLRSFTPQHAEVDKAILDLQVQLAAVERQRREEELRAQQRAAEELRRQRQRATLRQVGHRALDGGDWAAARAATRAAREAFPGDPEIDRLCQEIEDDAEKREAAARLQEAARQHLEAAESALAAGDLDAARASVELSLGLLPTHARAVRLQTKINERIARAEQERLARERAEEERLEQARLARERAEQERREQERIERERAEQERREQERIARERAEQERLEQARLARERAEQEQREQERIAQERAEQERLARERAEEERLEQARLARERAEQERREQERIERERAEQEQREQERIARERAEEERLARERAEQDRAEQERLEQERLARERAEQERREQERLERAEQEQREQERIARERAEEERLARERAEQDRAEQERLEQERLARERAEQEQREQARLERERAEQEQREQERIARERAEQERAEQERLTRERAEQERREREWLERAEQEQREQERIAQERAEQERLAREHAEEERLEQARLARERAEQERREQERLERERAEQEQREQERIARQRAEEERLARERAELERAEQERLEWARLARERADQERREQERRERERAEQEQREQERIARERAEEERLARERAEQERAEQERLTRERAEQERRERERLEHERAEQERLTRERAEQERAARERDEQERLARQREEQERIAQERAEQKRIAAERKEQVRAAEKRAKQERQAEKERLRRERQQQKRDQEAALASQRQEESTDLSASTQEVQLTQADEREAAEPIAQTEMVSPADAVPTLLSTPVTVVDVPTAIDDPLARAQRYRESREYETAFELLRAVLVDRAADPGALQLRAQVVNDVREALRQDPANAHLQSLLVRYGTVAPRQRWLTQALVAAAALAVITTLGLFLYNRAPVDSVEGPRTATPTTVPETAPPTDKPVAAPPVPELPPAPPAIVETVVTINLLPWARVEITAADPTVKVPSGPHVTPFAVSLPSGDYTLRAENGGLTPERVLPLTVVPGKPITISETMPGFNAGRIVDTLLGAQR